MASRYIAAWFIGAIPMDEYKAPPIEWDYSHEVWLPSLLLMERRRHCHIRWGRKRTHLSRRFNIFMYEGDGFSTRNVNVKGARTYLDDDNLRELGCIIGITTTGYRKLKFITGYHNSG